MNTFTQPPNTLILITQKTLNVQSAHFSRGRPAMTDNNSKQPDSIADVHIGRSHVRKAVGIRVDSGVWEAFKQAVLTNGLSTCDILERLMIGVTVGLTVKVHTSNTINVAVDFVKEVKRVRRYAREVEEGSFPVDEGGWELPRCAYNECGVPGVVVMRKESVGRCFVCPGHLDGQMKRGWVRVT